MTAQRIAQLLDKSVDPSTVTVVGNFTKPRTWGVYKVPLGGQEQAYFHYMGNHPVREAELRRMFGEVYLVVLFTERGDARELQLLLNDGRHAIHHRRWV
jgi:hypothetical protein